MTGWRETSSMYRSLIGDDGAAPARASWARILAACAGGLALVGCGGGDWLATDGGQDVGVPPDDGDPGHDDGTCTDGTGMYGTRHDTTQLGHETATASCTATGSNGSGYTGTRDTTGTKDSCTADSSGTKDTTFTDSFSGDTTGTKDSCTTEGGSSTS